MSFSDLELDMAFPEEDSDSSDDDFDYVGDQFNKYADHIQEIHSKLSKEDLLELYSLYKQATVGKCNTKDPGILNVKARAKWNAWKNLGDMGKMKAMKKYIRLSREHDPEWAPLPRTPSWFTVPLPKRPSDRLLDSDKTPVDFVKESNLAKLKEILKSEDIDKLDESGLGLIHWATDRNEIAILEYLLESGANVNFRDYDRQTALHYASSCGHTECMDLLLKFGADTTVKDKDGKNYLDVAYDEELMKPIDPRYQPSVMNRL